MDEREKEKNKNDEQEREEGENKEGDDREDFLLSVLYFHFVLIERKRKEISRRASIWEWKEEKQHSNNRVKSRNWMQCTKDREVDRREIKNNSWNFRNMESKKRKKTCKMYLWNVEQNRIRIELWK